MTAPVRSDRRQWPTLLLFAVLMTWVTGIASGFAFLDEPDGAVFARIAFVLGHPGVRLCEQVGGWATIVAAGAIVAHLIAAASHRIVKPSAVVVALAGVVMCIGWSGYALGMRDCADVHLTRWFFVVLASSVVVAVCGVAAARVRPAPPTSVAPARLLRSSAGRAARSR
jgi:cytochrome b subunit of formate dehydrogenase